MTEVQTHGLTHDQRLLSKPFSGPKLSGFTKEPLILAETNPDFI